MFFKKQKNKLSPKSCHLKASSGFTLIELLLAMAIIAIMSGAILMSLGQQRKKANQSRLLGELSSVIQPILMCRSDNGTINEVANGGSGGTAICSISNDYSAWPSITNTDFAAAAGGTGYRRDADFDDGSWYFYVDDTSVRICCNSASSKCQSLSSGAACTVATPAY